MAGTCISVLYSCIANHSKTQWLKTEHWLILFKICTVGRKFVSAPPGIRWGSSTERWVIHIHGGHTWLVTGCWLQRGALVLLAWASVGCLGFLLKWWLAFKSNLPQESPADVILPWKSCSVTSAIVSRLPTFEENGQRPHSWMERVSKSYWRSMCGVGDYAVALLVKYNLSHHTRALWCALSQRASVDLQWALGNDLTL